MDNDQAWRVKYGRLALGSIVFDDGTVTPLDWRDLMWAVRAVRGEAGPALSSGIETDAILWTMTNRLRVVKDSSIGLGEAKHDPPHRLHHLLLAYCEPINPYQRNRGTAEQQAKREHYAAMGPDDDWINPASVPRVVDVLRGQVSRVPYMRLVDFADCNCEGCGADVHGAPDLRLANCFWSGPAGRALDEHSVFIAPPSPSWAKLATAGLIGVAGAGALLDFAR